MRFIFFAGVDRRKRSDIQSQVRRGAEIAGWREDNVTEAPEQLRLEQQLPESRERSDRQRPSRVHRKGRQQSHHVLRPPRTLAAPSGERNGHRDQQLHLLPVQEPKVWLPLYELLSRDAEARIGLRYVRMSAEIEQMRMEGDDRAARKPLPEAPRGCHKRSHRGFERSGAQRKIHVFLLAEVDQKRTVQGVHKVGGPRERRYVNAHCGAVHDPIRGRQELYLRTEA